MKSGKAMCDIVRRSQTERRCEDCQFDAATARVQICRPKRAITGIQASRSATDWQVVWPIRQGSLLLRLRFNNYAG